MGRFTTALGADLEYEHALVRPGNSLTPARYRTKVYMWQGRSRYELGAIDGKLDEEAVETYLIDTLSTEQERSYGQQNTLLRRELAPRRQVNPAVAAGGSIASRYKRFNA